MDRPPPAMTLLASSRSPFARKVLVAAHEIGVAERLRIERVVVSANKPNAAVMAAGSIIGGYGAAGIARRIGRKAVRRIVIIIGFAMTISLLIRQK